MGRDPELKTLDSGRKLVRLSMATNDFYKDASGNRVEETQWHNLVGWGGLAETIEKHVSKGQELAVSGKLVHRSYEDNDGVTRYVTEVVLNDFVFIGGSKAA